MASSEDAEWYLEGSGVPVGWKEGAVAFRMVPFEPLLCVSDVGVAIGAMAATGHEDLVESAMLMR